MIPLEDGQDIRRILNSPLMLAFRIFSNQLFLLLLDDAFRFFSVVGGIPFFIESFHRFPFFVMCLHIIESSKFSNWRDDIMTYYPLSHVLLRTHPHAGRYVGGQEVRLVLLGI